jgi:hypothetical protein
VHEEEKTPPQLTQGILFQETESEIITIENCQAISTAAVQTIRGKKEWTCTFMALPDLWHQDRNEIVYARAREEDKIRAASHTRLQPGDFATLKGIVTQKQVLVRGNTHTRLIYLNVTEIRPGLRASSSKVNGRSGRKKDPGQAKA